MLIDTGVPCGFVILHECRMLSHCQAGVFTCCMACCYISWNHTSIIVKYGDILTVLLPVKLYVCNEILFSFIYLFVYLFDLILNYFIKIKFNFKVSFIQFICLSLMCMVLLLLITIPLCLLTHPQFTTSSLGLPAERHYDCTGSPVTLPDPLPHILRADDYNITIYI